MRAIPRAVRLVAIFLLCAGLAAAQAKPGVAPPSAKARKTPAAAFRNECTHSGFCISVPAAWKRIADVFNDLGFVAAEPRAGADPAAWPQLTVVAFAPPKSGGAVPSLDTLVERMLAPEGALASAQTLERSRLLLNGSPAQIVRVEFRDDSGKPTAIEEVALIAGDDGLIYSIGLHCAPQEFDRLEPVFQQAARSWHLQAAAAPSSAPRKPSAARPSHAPPAAPQPKPNPAKP